MKCEYCKEEIKKDQRYVLLGTYVKTKEVYALDKKISEYFYHLRCWKDYLHDALRGVLDDKTKMAMGLFKKLSKKILEMTQ